MKLEYRPEIDGLRAIAVVAVIFYHAQITIFCQQPFKGGFIGVDIFFVISGYLITSIILKELITTGSFSFKYFYERRIRRILPALLTVMLVSVPFAWIYLIPDHFEDFSNSILYSLGFNSNYYFWRSGQIYGAVDGTLKPFLHTWSLSVEEQFYILFPITIFIVFKYFRKYLIYLLFAGLITSFILAEWIGRHYPHFSFYVLPTRAWELIAGSILAHLELNNNRISKNQILMRVLPSVGILMILFSIFIISDKLRNPSIHTLLPILGVSLIIWFSNKDELITKILSTKLFIGIGLISYSLYLWHYPIFAFGKIIDLTSSIFSNFELISLTVFLSILSYLFIEKPARNKKNKFKKVFLFLLSVILILVPINSAVVYYEGVKIDSRVHPLLWKYHDERANFVKNYNFNNFDHRENVLIIGNSYAEDLLNVLSRNKNLKKKYYFYVAKPKEFKAIYQLRCFYDFLSKNDLSCRKEDFSFLIEQYKKSNYIILHVRRSWHYQTDWFLELIDLLRKDKKEFIILLDDVSYADVLDIYLKSNNKVPDKQELTELEKVFFRHAKSWNRQSLDKARKVLIENDLKFLGRSEIYCDYNERKCPLLIDGDKLYVDEGHVTNHGAEYFSIRAEKLINQLID